MKISIYSLKKVLYQDDAESLNCRTVSGEITVLDHHRPLISMLTSGIIKITNTNQQVCYFPIASGFLEVKDTNEARLLVEEAFH